MLTQPSHTLEILPTPIQAKADPLAPPAVQTLYTSALTNLLHRQPRLALSQCLKAFQIVQYPSEIHNSFWVIYVTALSKDLKGGVDERERVKELWDKVVDRYGGVPGDVEPKVVVACILLCLHRNLLAQARSVAESWIATLSEQTVVFLEQRRDGDDEVKIRTGYERVVELYLLHVLARMEDWEGAKEFLNWNEMLTEEKKKNYQTYIKRLHRKSLRLRSPPTPTPSPSSPQKKSDDGQPHESVPSPSPVNPHPVPVKITSSEQIVPTKKSPVLCSPIRENETTTPEVRFRTFLRTLIGPRSAFSVLMVLFTLVIISTRKDRLRPILKGTWMKIVGTVKMGTSMSTL